MPRYDRPEEDDYRDGPPRKKSNTTLVIVLAAAGFLFVACTGVGLMLLLGWGAAQSVPPPAVAVPAAKVAKRTYTREEFREKAIGKTVDEVRALFGVPAKTNVNNEGQPHYWRYEDATVDPVTGKVDVSTYLWFGKDGRVERVTF